MNAVVNGKPGVIGATIGSRSQISAQTPPGAIAYTYYGVNGSPVGHEPGLNLIAGPNVLLSGADNPGANRVDITVSATVAPVASVFGRTGAVVAVAGDYSAAQVTNAVDKTQVYADPAWISSLSWAKIAGAPATGVASVFGRSGAVVAASGDYTAAQVTNAADTSQSYANPAWIASLAWSKITGAPAAGVSSVFGRVGAVIATTGDYAAAQITNAADTSQSYADPAWISSLAWSKITGVPALGTGSVTSVALTMPAEFTVAGSPITQAGTFAVTKASQAANLVYASPSGAAGAPVFRALVAADLPAGFGQTPWLQNINAAGFTLSNIPSISASAGLALSAQGAGNIGLNTNAKARLTVDSAGHVAINAPDDAPGSDTSVSHLKLTGSTVQRIVGDAPNVSLSAPSGQLVAYGSTQFQIQTAVIAKQRLLVDSVGHVTINAPDSGSTPMGLYMASPSGGATTDNILETAGWGGVTCNVYYSGSTWYLRNAGHGMILRSDTARGIGMWAAPSGAAGSAASVYKVMDIVGGGAATFSAASMAFQTNNSTTRLAIDANGSLTINPRDSDGQKTIYFGTAQNAFLTFDPAGSATLQSALHMSVWAGGSGSLSLGTSAKQRVTIDSAGSITIPANDSGNGSYLYGSGNPFNLVAATDLYVNAAGLVNINSGSSRKVRMQINAAGNCIINTPDSGYPLTVNGAPGISLGGNLKFSASRSVIYWQGDQAAWAGGLQIIGTGTTIPQFIWTDANGAYLPSCTLALGSSGSYTVQTCNLAVNGAVSITGPLTFQDGTQQTTAASPALNYQYAQTGTTAFLNNGSWSVIPNFTITIPVAGTYAIEVMAMLFGNMTSCGMQVLANGAAVGGISQIGAGVNFVAIQTGQNYYVPAPWKITRACAANDKITIQCAGGASGSCQFLYGYMTAHRYA